jgi:DNA ligase-1
VKKEIIEVDEDDEDEEPVVKRVRRNGRADEMESKSSKPKPKPRVKEEEAEEEPKLSKSKPKPKVKKEEVEEEPKLSKSKTKVKAQPEPKKVKSVAAPPKPVKEEDDIEEVSSSKAVAKSGSDASASATESASEAEEDAEEDEEDEKPEVAAKAREKIQTTLMSKAKDPYPDWKPGEPVPYAALCTTFSLIEMTSKRLIITSHCSLFLRQVLRLTPNDLLATVLLMINKLAADYAGIELGIGESLIMKAIGETTGRSLAVIKEDQKEIGDLGLVAVKSRANQPTMFKPKALTVAGVLKGLIAIATTSGSGAQGRKVDGIKKLLSAADGHRSGKVDITKDKGGASEAKFIVRFLEGKLRLGLAERTVLVSLAQAMVCHEVEAQGSGKVPSTEKLAEGEAILKSVYR